MRQSNQFIMRIPQLPSPLSVSTAHKLGYIAFDLCLCQLYLSLIFVITPQHVITAKHAHITLDLWNAGTVYPKKYAHGFVVLCFVVVMQSFIINSHEIFIHTYQGCFAGTGAIVRLPQCQWSKPDGYGKISQWIATTKHSKAKTACIFLGIYCTCKDCMCKYFSPSEPVNTGYDGKFYVVVMLNLFAKFGN